MRFLILATGLLALAAPAMSATIDISSFSKDAYTSAVSGFASAVVEDFEAFPEGNVANGFSTAVGSFSSLGGIGSGGSVTGAGFANDGSLLAVRDGNVFGRTSTTAQITGNTADDRFLDSNDTYGIRWDVSLGGSMFDRILFSLTDAADSGARLVLSVAGASTVISGLANGSQRLIDIDLGGSFSSASVFLTSTNADLTTLRRNDGFSIDDIAVSAVPLPASSLLLLGAIGGFAAMARRRRTVPVQA